MMQVVLSALVGLIVGSGAGFGLALLLVGGLWARLLGPRYAEFDIFGVWATAIISGLLALVLGVGIAVRDTAVVQRFLQPGNIAVVIGIPAAVLMLLGLTDGNWLWLCLMHIAACTGVVASAAVVLRLRRR